MTATDGFIYLHTNESVYSCEYVLRRPECSLNVDLNSGKQPKWISNLLGISLNQFYLTTSTQIFILPIEK